jgi:hypothetical protein
VAILTHNFDGGPHNTTITVLNSGQSAGNDAFTGVFTSGANTELKYSSDYPRPTAEFTAKFATGVATGQSLVWWTTAAKSQIWMRAYCYFSSALDNVESPLYFAAENSVGTTCAALGVLSFGGQELLILDSLGNYMNTTAAPPVGAWFRVEARMQFSATTGNADLRYYEEADAALDDFTEQLTWSSRNFASNSAINFYFGYATNDPDLEPLYMSNIAVSDEDWIGPAPYRAGKGVPGILTNPTAIHTNAW